MSISFGDFHASLKDEYKEIVCKGINGNGTDKK